MKKVLAITLASVLAFTLVGCGKIHIKNTPPGVIDTEVAAWFQADGAVRTLSDTVQQLTTAAIQLHSQFPSEAAYQATLNDIGRIDQYGIEASRTLQASPQHFDTATQGKVSGTLDQILSTLVDANGNGLTQIKNSGSSATLNTLLITLQSTLKTLFAISKPAGTPLPESLK